MRSVLESLASGAGVSAPPHTQSHTPSQPSAFVRVAQSTHRSKYIRPWALPEHESWPAADCTLLPSWRGIGAGGASAVSGKGSRRVVAAVCRGIGDSAVGEEERKSMRSGAGCRRGKRRASRRDLANPPREDEINLGAVLAESVGPGRFQRTGRKSTFREAQGGPHFPQMRLYRSTKPLLSRVPPKTLSLTQCVPFSRRVQGARGQGRSQPVHPRPERVLVVRDEPHL